MAIDKAITYLKKNAPKGEFLAYINPKEAAMLKKAGGSGKKVNGIPSYRSKRGMESKARSRSYSSPSKSPSRSPRGPQELGTSTRTVNRITAPPPTTYIGGKKYNVTPDNRDERNRAELKQQLTRQPVGGNRIDKLGNTKKSLVNRGAGGINGLIRLLIGSVHPAAGLLMGGFDRLKSGLGSLTGNINEALGDFREKRTGFRTQQEWEDARTQRQLQKRLDNLYDRKAKGKDFSQNNIDMLESQYGLSPSTAQNVLTGRDLKGFTESRGLQIPISNEVVDTPNVPMGTPWDNPYEAPMGTPWDNPYKAPDSPEWTSWEVPPGMMNDAYQDNLKFFDNLNKGIVENNEPPMVNTDNVMQGSVLDATPKKGIMESISDWFSSSQQPETIVEDNVPVSNYDVRPDFYPGNKYQNTTIDNGLISIDEGVWAPKPGEWGYRGPLRLAEGGLASMFTRRG